MPNWIEGTLKIRGTYENVKGFFMNGLEVNSYNVDFEKKAVVATPIPKEKWFKLNEAERECSIALQSDNVYVIGTKRAFLQNQDFYFYHDEDNEPVIACVDFQQAWSIVAENWAELSKKYGVDFRLYGFERGMEFCQEVEIINGEITMNDEIKYDDWDWECPFPKMGG